MKKYFNIFATSFKEDSKSILNTFLSALTFSIIIYIFVQLWSYIYSNGQPVIAGYDLNGMIWYLIGTEIIAFSCRGKRIIREMGQDVKSGRISYQLNKPYNYYLYSVFNNLGQTLLKYLLMFVAGALIGLLLVGPIPSFNILHVFPILISFLLAAVINSASFALIGIAVFWIEDAEPLAWIYGKFLLLLGVFFPPELFPSYIQPFVIYSPVYAIYSGPAKLMSQFSMELFATVTTMQTIYVVVFLLLGMFAFSRATRKVNINGG